VRCEVFLPKIFFMTWRTLAKDDRVKVHYRGTLIDGKEFDSSYSRGQPTEFGVGQVIAGKNLFLSLHKCKKLTFAQGWTEGLQLMSVGDKFKFFIPADLAYGERGAGRDIGPNSALIFEVELIGIPSQKSEL
jgi:FKBP-type peptidyl-prolyl cis-trans isomerase